MLKRWISLGAVAIAMLGATGIASASIQIPDVAIEKALSSSQFKVTFSYSTAKLVELKVNGMSVGTRVVNGELEGSANFRIDQAVLNEGQNKVEALVFDASGKLLGVENSTITVDPVTDSPVVVTMPKAGQTVLGLVNIQIELKRTFGKAYASFMVDGEWKALRNFEPYSYVLDTESLSNGWHEIQVWVVDENNTTWKSRKVRIFVNNPGGRTDRIETPPTVATVPPVPAVTDLKAMAPTIAGQTAKPVGTRPMTVTPPKSSTTSVRSLTPTGKRTAPVTKPATVKPATKPVTTKPVTQRNNGIKPLPAVNNTKPVTTKPVTTKPVVKPAQNVTAATQTVRITKGTRVNYSGALSLTYNARVVQFDVQPRVTNGVPFTPFRHLYEAAGGNVKWTNDDKTVRATGASDAIILKIGDKTALLGSGKLTLEYAPFIERGRTVVPLSFIGESLKVKVDFDPKSGHVLITKI